MIESVEISQEASYGPEPEHFSDLDRLNFLFGSNGSGKTTISRVIADESSYPTCRVTWLGGSGLRTDVYNRDFVDRNFSLPAGLKGVFTLGEGHAEVLSKIEKANEERRQLSGKILSLRTTLDGEDGSGGKLKDRADLDTRFRDRCWEEKQRHDEKLAGAFRGYRGSTEKFKNKVLAEQESNTAELVDLQDLEALAETVFAEDPPTTEALLPPLDFEAIIALEKDPTLSKKIVGKEDVDLAGMIKALGNSDWVRVGIPFLSSTDGVCPFCQQDLPAGFEERLADYFDETFEKDSRRIQELRATYRDLSAKIVDQLQGLVESPSSFLETEKLEDAQTLLSTLLASNLRWIETKEKEASRVIELESVAEVAGTITAMIRSANKSIEEHNRLVSNLAEEQAALTAKVWRYLLDRELKTEIATFIRERDDLQKAVESLNEQIRNSTSEMNAKDQEIRELERRTTSVQPTIDGINALLSEFGFRGFMVAPTDDGRHYKLVRPNGEDARETLSEGERSFVTFLYFFYLLRGSNSESGITEDRVVVFDDPVSSLDSDILFVVSSLIRSLFEGVQSNTSRIKQLFVFTHNVYFHKEVTFNQRSGPGRLRKKTFWTVRKTESGSRLQRHKSNPVKTVYELLWAEVRKPDPSSLTIQNTLRRILENYFQILGDVDPEMICDKFQGEKKKICKSLFSWVNAGSHFAHDDLCYFSGDSTVDAYLTVFKEIFDVTDHRAHYDMMIKATAPGADEDHDGDKVESDG